MTELYRNPYGTPLRSREEAVEAARRNHVEASAKAKRGWNTRRRNSGTIDRMIADAVARDTR